MKRCPKSLVTRECLCDYPPERAGLKRLWPYPGWREGKATRAFVQLVGLQMAQTLWEMAWQFLIKSFVSTQTLYMNVRSTFIQLLQTGNNRDVHQLVNR